MSEADDNHIWLAGKPRCYHKAAYLTVPRRHRELNPTP
jgi:hypothetical protein